jgi:hypothetical protein
MEFSGMVPLFAQLLTKGAPQFYSKPKGVEIRCPALGREAQEGWAKRKVLQAGLDSLEVVTPVARLPSPPKPARIGRRFYAHS